MIEVSRLRELLHYDPETGVLTNRVLRGRKAKVGAVAGVPNSLGYLVVRIDSANYLAHRIAWAIQTGKWPPEQVDHVNTHRSDNRWINLREANNSENNRNRGPQKNNMLGLKGVYFDKERGLFIAKIKLSGKSVWLGRFNCPAAAHFAYVIKASELHGEFARAS